jgi:hypothetical protein
MMEVGRNVGGGVKIEFKYQWRRVEGSDRGRMKKGTEED